MPKAQRARAFAKAQPVAISEDFGYDQVMEIKIQLSEREQHWLEQIASHSELSASDAIKNLIKEKHESMAMELAFEQYPDGQVEGEGGANESSRSSRKAALKRSLIERASQKIIETPETKM